MFSKELALDDPNSQARPSSAGPALFTVVLAGASGAGGMLWIASHEPAAVQTFEGLLLTIAQFLLACFITVFAHVVIHELGHLVCGLISGYRFVTLRVGRHMLVRDHGTGRLQAKTYPAGHTGIVGQCLMQPPQPREGSFPFMLYNFGGGLANMVAALVVGTMLRLMPWSTIPGIIGVAFTVVGLYLATTNLIPMRFQGISNDGSNVRLLDTDENMRRAFWATLQIHALLARGARLRDVPASLFDIPQHADKDNAMICSWAVIRSEACLDLHDFESVLRFHDEWYAATGAVPLLKNRMLCVFMFLQLLGGIERDTVAHNLDEGVAALLQRTGCALQVPRLMYTRALLIEGDTEKASKWLSEFDQIARSWPYAGEIATEIDLMSYVKGLFVERLGAKRGEEHKS